MLTFLSIQKTYVFSDSDSSLAAKNATCANKLFAQNAIQRSALVVSCGVVIVVVLGFYKS